MSKRPLIRAIRTYVDAALGHGSLPLPSARQRDVSIETLRGFACLLLVAFHVIGSTPETGMRIPEGSTWRLFNDLAVHIRMPLFAFISGYVFNAIAPSWMDVGVLLKNKLRRLGIPLVVVSYLFYLASCTVGTAGSEFCAVSPWQIVVFPYAHYWYLQSSLTIMVVVAVGTFAVGANPRLLTAIALPISAMLFLFGPVFSVNPFSANGAVYLFPFFLLGQTMRAWSILPYFVHNREQRQVALLVLGAILIVAWTALYHMISGHNVINVSRRSMFGLGLSVLSCLFLFLLRPRVRLLAIVGPFSYAIYLFHAFFTTACRHLLHMLDADISRAAPFAISLLAGILFPILVHRIALRYRFTALLLLGIDTVASSRKLLTDNAHRERPEPP